MTIGVGLALALLGGLSWALLDVIRKRVGEKASATAVVAALTLWQLPFLGTAMGIGEVVDETVGDLTEPWSIILGGFPTIPPEYLWPFIGAVALNVAANWLFLRAVQISPLGLTIPYLSFTPVFTAITGLLALGERPTVWGWSGIVLVAAGAFLLNSGDSRHGLLAPLRALWDERGSFYMLVVAGLWSITPVIDKVAVGQTSVMGHTAFIAAGIFAVFYLFRAAIDRNGWAMLREFGNAPLLLAFAGFINVLAMVFQLSAYSYMDVAYVETVKRAMGVVAAVVLGWWVFDEGDLRRRLIAAALMVAGVAMVLLEG